MNLQERIDWLHRACFLHELQGRPPQPIGGVPDDPQLRAALLLIERFRRWGTAAGPSTAEGVLELARAVLAAAGHPQPDDDETCGHDGDALIQGTGDTASQGPFRCLLAAGHVVEGNMFHSNGAGTTWWDDPRIAPMPSLPIAPPSKAPQKRKGKGKRKSKRD